MENKNVGWLIIGLAALMIIIILLFNTALKDIVRGSCTVAHGEAELCPMFNSINQQTYFALAVVGILIIVGLVLIFSKPKEKLVIKRITEKKPQKSYNISQLKPEEKQVFKMIQEQGAIFQADLIEKTGLGKVTISRIIDRLEGKGYVERKRRGMTNVVVLKED